MQPVCVIRFNQVIHIALLNSIKEEFNLIKDDGETFLKAERCNILGIYLVVRCNVVVDAGGRCGVCEIEAKS